MTSEHRLPRRRPISGGLRTWRTTALLTVLVMAVAGCVALFLPASPGFSEDYTGTLRSGSRTATHAVTAQAGTLTASLTFVGTQPTSGSKQPTATLTLRDSAGTVVARQYGVSPVRLSTKVAAGNYRLEVSTSWPLAQRDLSYQLTVQVTPTAPPTTAPPTTAPPTTAPPTTAPPTTAPPTTAPPTTAPPTTAPPTTAPPTKPAPSATPPAAGDVEQAICGTWVLYQVSSATDLQRLRTHIDAALALPGVVGLSVRFPWDAADLTGNQTTNALLDEAADIAHTAGKALSIRFMAGAHTPQRVFDAGAASYQRDGHQVPLPWDNATGSHQVFLNAYADYVAKLATWSTSHDVHLLHLSWYGQDWAELNHGAEVRAAPGYTEKAWLDGHRDLIDVGARFAGPTLAVELPLSGYGPLSGGQSATLADYITTLAGTDQDHFLIQANGWDETQEWGSPSTNVETDFDKIWAKPLTRGLQMIQPDGYDWSKVFDRLDATNALYGEIYLPSFWQVPGPTPAYSHNTTTRITQLQNEIKAFSQSRCG